METLHTILLVDDEPMVRDLCRMLLERQGYEVLTAADGQQALDVFQEYWRQIGLVVLDWTLPRLSGDEVFRHMVQMDPEVRILFCSGYPPDHIRALGHPRIFGYLAKPFHNRDFVNTVRNLFGSHVGGGTGHAGGGAAESAANPY
jgi:DNA-binding response OmpR family regulator